jgi:hypothetical protein
MNPQALPCDRSLNSLPAESIKKAAIRKLTPAQEGAIRKRRSLLMYPAWDSNSNEVPLTISTSAVVGARIHRSWLALAFE